MVCGCMISRSIGGRSASRNNVVTVRIACLFVLDLVLIPCSSIPHIITFFVVATLMVSIVVSMGTTMMTSGLIGHARFKAVVDRTMWMTGFINAVGCPCSGLILRSPFQKLLMSFVCNVFAIAMI